jgi:hypothetical protein
MSNFTQILAISAFAWPTAFFVFYFSTKTNELANQIVTGFIGDHPIPIAQRWLMLYSNWTSYVIAGLSALFFVALAAVFIADHVGHADSKLLAYVFAFFVSAGAVIWVAQGTVLFISYRSVLRRAEAD